MEISPDQMTLGTQLRHLADLLDGDVVAVYVASGLDYRPRYTPVVRALLCGGGASIREISRRAGLTHSALSQTVAQMLRAGLVEVAAGSDARERIVALTPTARAMVPALRRQWAATNAAAAALDRELSAPLGALLAEAIAAIERTPFAERIALASSPAAPAPRRTKSA